MRRCASWCAAARRRWRTCARSASTCRPSCCATAGSTKAHARWLAELAFEHPAQHLVLREYRQAIEDAAARLDQLTRQVAEAVPAWSMAPVEVGIGSGAPSISGPPSTA
jgi:hypothetical protein